MRRGFGVRYDGHGLRSTGPSGKAADAESYLTDYLRDALADSREQQGLAVRCSRGAPSEALFHQTPSYRISQQIWYAVAGRKVESSRPPDERARAGGGGAAAAAGGGGQPGGGAATRAPCGHAPPRHVGL